VDAPKPAAAIPGAKEMVSIRLDRDVLDFFPGRRAGLAGAHQRSVAQSRWQIRFCRPQYSQREVYLRLLLLDV